MTPDQVQKKQQERQHRMERIATLHDHPGWLALADLMQEELRYERLDVTQPQWEAKVAYKAGRVEKTLDILKVVAAAHTRTATATMEVMDGAGSLSGTL